MKKRLLIITPHLSTGGAPQVTANKIALIKDDFEIKVVEHSFVAWSFIVQRNRIRTLIGDENFYSLGENKKQELEKIINDFQPQVISMEEFPEMFLDKETSDYLYSSDRNYTIIETTHDSSFNHYNKAYMPDKFVFVSPYNALRYNHLSVPFEIIEYPVDKKPRDKRASREKLGLEHDYRHVVIIGLFTPRKNQKYVFEIADRLSEHKIKFHFLGNQAGNFEHYWKPLMDWKENNPNLDNCVIWGERDDTEEFIKASDLFLFASKGDRGNKELNPIVIKESLEYNIPKLLHNLDVYLNRYEKVKDEENIHYLSGDLIQDTQKVIDICSPKTKINKDEVIILGTYPNLKSRVQLTKDTIKSLKPLGRKIMLLSHYPVDDDIQKMVDYYIYDNENPLTHHSYYTRFFRHTNEFEVEVNINGLKNSNQSLTVLTNLFNGAKAAKLLGFKSFFYTTYDVILHENDLDVVEGSFASLRQGVGAFLGTLNTPFGKGIQTNGMTFDVDFFLNKFHDVRKGDEYNRICQEIGAQNFLEDYLAKVIDQNLDKVVKIDNPQETLLTNSGLGVASNSEYYSILPIDKETNTYMFYFFTYNIDERKVNIVMKENGGEFYNTRFQISKSREFKKEFQYNGSPIEVILDFYDGDDIYKSETYLLNSQNINKYSNTGFFKWKNKMPKIKLVHIQTTRNDEREQRSRESLQRVSQHNIEYILHLNEPYGDLPPKYNCQRPQCVSMELFDEPTIQELGTALTPAHYGCFDAFKNAILSEFDSDFLIVCEGDCIIESSIEEFVAKVYQAAKICDENNIGYFSFGDTKTLEHGWLQSPVVEVINNQDLLFVTNHIIGLQCIMFPKNVKKYLHEQLRTHKWDASDMFFNMIFRHSPYKMGILHHRITTQAEGFSLIDQQAKKFL